jgi:hypothetical protein
VEVLHAYANPNPQLDAILNHLAEPAEPWNSPSGPSSEPCPDCDPEPDDAPPVLPRPLNRRLTAEQREAIVMTYAGGTAQKALAIEYGISSRSVKRLVSKARRSGADLRTRAI